MKEKMNCWINGIWERLFFFFLLGVSMNYDSYKNDLGG